MQRLLRSVGDAERRGTEVWLFGSACNSDTPCDIDILIVYDTDVLSMDQAINFRRRLSDLIAEEAGVPADILLLKRTEAAETKFLSRVDAIKIDCHKSTTNPTGGS
jgi:predicted nucleotidyltransferase